MATYRELHGKAVKTVTTNPSDDAAEGQIWFNSTDNTFKSAIVAEAWHSSGVRVTNSIPAGQGGTQNAAWFCGGTLSGSGPGTNTEEYNGSGWSTGGTLNTARRYGQGWGTQTAAITASGSPMSPPNSGMTATEEYNGTAWTTGTAVPSPYVRYNGAGMGAVQTAGAIFCGDQNPPPLNTTLEWDGSSWAGGGNYPFSGPIGTGSAGGTLTAGIAMGGPSQGNVVCKYDGSSWTTTTNYPDSKSRIGVAGTQTAAIGFGGQNSSGTTTNAFLFDGSTFTATGSLGVTNSSGSGHYGMGGSSPSTATVGTFQGDSSTEEFNQSASVITAAAWASGANIGTARNNLSGCGTQTAALIAGGDDTDPSYLAVVEEYNGTSWSEQNDLPANRRSGAMAGTQTASIYFGGQSYPNVQQEESFKYDGSSWTSGGNLPVTNAFGGVAGTGTQTAALGVGGYSGNPGSYINTVFEYNGSSWSANPNNYPAAVTAIGHCGTQTAALLSGGATSPGAFQSTSFTYDGSSFSAAPSLIFAHSVAAAGGTQTDAIICTGQTTPQPTASSQAQGYDGTSWSSRPGVSSVRRYSGSGKNTSPASASWVAGGYTGSADTNSHEEFTGETTSLNVKTLTQS